jgi:DNA primase
VTVELPSDAQKIFFEQAASQYQQDLAVDTAAQVYLKSRGIDHAVADTFRLGVLRNPLLGHEQFRGRLAIPYITAAGIVTFTFRCLQDHVCKDTVTGVTPEGKEVRCRKYRAPSGMERTLYNVSDFKKNTDVIYICEGEIDALTLSVCGFAAIAIPGVSQWKPHFTRCFADYPQIFVVADGDDAGYRLGAFLSVEVKARAVRPPQGQDVNSIYAKGGTNAVQQWLAGATAA